ncbi:MAG: glycosyltransferase [Candidatus Kapaibacterium sp.]
MRKKLIYESDYEPRVTVLVPARNEEDKIARCLDSLTRINYPEDKLEIIIVNDRSEDRTSDIIDQFVNKYDNMQRIDVVEEIHDKNLRGKPGAIQKGADNATGDLLIMTDADCTVDPEWVRTIATGFSDPEVGFIAAYTHIDPETVFARVQALEWIYMHTMACGGLALGQPLGCYGNNLSVRTKTFREINGYRGVPFSVTEDLALLQHIVRAGYKARYYCHPKATVTTLPEPTFGAYIKQHHRWAIGGQNLGWRAVAFVVTSVALWAGIFTSLFCGEWLLTAGLLGARLIGDFSIIFSALRILGRPRIAWWIFPSVFFFMFIELIIPFVLLDKDIEWKGQTFSARNQS